MLVWQPLEMSRRTAHVQPQASEVICLDSDDEAVRLCLAIASSCCRAGTFVAPRLLLQS